MGRSIKPSTGAAAPKVESSKGKRIVAIIIMAAGILLLMFAASAAVSNKQEVISVIRLTRSLKAGDVITEDALAEYAMLKTTYDGLGVVELPDPNNPDRGVKTQVIVPWAQRQDVIGKYMGNYVSKGTYLTTQDITSEVTTRNPWIQTMKEDEEIYTMAFDAGTINTRLIFPGTRLRVRLLQEVPVDKVEELRKLISTAESANLDLIVHESTVIKNGELVEEATAKDAFNVAEIVINNITITDMTNAAGESIYDLYCSLLKLPVNQRLKYLRTELGENETATSWAQRVTPSTITFILDKDSASRLAEFEQGVGSLKYTILPDDPDDENQANLMSQFVEISNQINTITDTVS